MFLALLSTLASCGGTTVASRTSAADCGPSAAIECLRVTYEMLATQQNALVDQANDASDAFAAAETADSPLEGNESKHGARVSSAAKRFQDAARRVADGDSDFVEAMLAGEWPSDLDEIRAAWADAMREEAAAMRRFADTGVDDFDLGLWIDATAAAELRADVSRRLRLALGLPELAQPPDASASSRPTTK